MDTQVKITHITRYAHPHIGGIESFINMLNNCIKQDNVKVEVLSCDNNVKSSIENNINYKRCKFLFEFASNTISPQFILELSKINSDILIYHMPFIFAVIAHFIAHPKYKKMIIAYHSDIIGYDKIMKPFWWIYNLFLEKADIIHVQSPQMLENSMVKRFKEKVVIIPYLIDITTHHNEVAVYKLKRQYINKKILFSLGRHVKYKGFKYLIEAMKQIENTVLLLGGNGPLTEEYKQYILDNHLEDKIILVGKISNAEIENYYEICDIFILPSIMKSETFAVVQLEAMKHSKPVINTNLGTGVNYVSIHGETGLTVEPANSEELSKAINILLEDDILREKLGQNARRRVEMLFDIDKVKEKYKNMILGNTKCLK